MIDTLAQICLKFGHESFIVPIIIFGLLFHKRELYIKAGCFFCAIIIFNTLLKYLFKIPLMPHLGNGYAFPSGHMHAATVFYGYLLCKNQNYIMKAVFICITCGIGISLVHCNFHDYLDVIGAAIFAVIEIFICISIEKKFGNKGLFYTVIIFASIIIALLFYFHKLEPHIWLASYVMLGFMIGAVIFPEKQPQGYIQKTAALTMIAIVLYAVTLIFGPSGFIKSGDIYIRYLKYLFIPIGVMGFIFVSTFIKKNKSISKK